MKIAPIQKERRIDRRNAVLETAWVEQRVSSTTEPAQPPNVEAGPCLVTVDDDLSAVREPLLQALERGARVYVVASLSCPFEELSATIPRNARLLVRRRVHVPVTSIATATSAHLRFGSRGAPWLVLEAPQREDLRTLFLQLFWRDATEEGWMGEGRMSWRPCTGPPFALPSALPPDASLRLEPPGSPLPWSDGAWVHTSAELQPSAGRLWCLPSGHDHARLRELSSRGVPIASSWPDLPDLVLTHSVAVARLPGETDRLRLELSAAQRSYVERLLRRAPRWEFRTDVRLGDLDAGLAVWLRNASTPAIVEARRHGSLGDVPAPDLASTRSHEPAPPEPPPLAQSFTYTFRVMPPMAPRGTTVDPLEERWSRFDNAWARITARAALAVESLESTATTTDVEELRRQLESLLTLRPSRCGPDATRAALARLAAIDSGQKKLFREVMPNGADAPQHRPIVDELPDPPGDALPRVGSLRMHKRERYLVIHEWEDCEQGVAEAGRLGATLVTSREPQLQPREEAP